MEYQLKTGPNKPMAKKVAIIKRFPSPIVEAQIIEKPKEEIEEFDVFDGLHVGDEFVISAPSAMGGDINTRVLGINRLKKCLLVRYKNEHYQYHTDTDKLFQLTDKDRCNDCGGFICDCQPDLAPPADTSMSNPTPFNTVITFPEGTIIPCVAGVIKTIFAPKDIPGFNGGLPSKVQEGYLVDAQGTEMAFSLPANHIQDVSTAKNRHVRIESVAGQNGMNGVKFKIDKWPDKTTGEQKTKMKLHVTSTAKLTFTTAGGTQAQTTQVPAKNLSGKPASAPPPQSTEGVSHVNQRIDEWFKVFDIVWSRSSQVKDANGNSIFSVDNLKDITTTMVLGFKGQYGVHAPVVFAGESQAMTQRQEEKAAPTNWKDFVHAKSNTKLGEAAPSDLLRWVRWATCTVAKDNEATEVKQLRLALCLAAHEKGWDNEDKLLQDSVLTQDPLATKKFEVWYGSGGIDAHQCLADFDNTMKAIQAISIPDDEIPE